MPTNLIPESTEANPRPGQQLRLASLSPQFDGPQHQLYCDLLVRAIDSPRTFNVALTGAYGTGKSSVLHQLRTDRAARVLELSLSTIAPESDDAAGEKAQPAVAESRTNQIQKEIVKQLLYRLPTIKVPRSGFRRTSAPDQKREWRIAVVAGFVVFAVLFGLGLIQPLVEGLLPAVWRQVVAYVILAGVAMAGAWVVGRLVRSRPTMSASMSSGPATVTLSKGSATYFDEYLDEIVYFFQVSQCDVVVIEDIDRFEDVKVFDTLRALNGLLNSSDQIARRIVFVYAIRDSVFERIGAAQKDRPPGEQEAPQVKVDRAKDTLGRASRTKFFDVIIPVVPFVSADNARDVMSKAMKSSNFKINPALIRLAARHVADMRLIHNIRNEFEVYRNRLVVSKTKMPGITDDLVFAIVLYKNTHLADFEKIRHQDSTLDRLYRRWRELVRENLATQTTRLVALRSDLSLELSADTRAADLGKRLVELGQVLGASVYPGAQDVLIELAGVTTEDNAADRDTWAVIASGQAQEITVASPRARSRGKGAVTFSFSAGQLSALLGSPVDPDQWKDVDPVDQRDRIAKAEEQIMFLRHHTWESLSRRAEFTLPSPTSEGDLVPKPPVVPAPADGTVEPPLTFDELLDQVLESDLACDLVRHGFLTSHFALYISSYYGEHLGPDGVEYTRRCIEPGVPDPGFKLKRRDVIQVLREQGAGKHDTADLFSDVGVYNVSILDYLLTDRPGAARTVAHSLVRMGALEREFLDTYVAHGTAPQSLLAAIAPMWPGVVKYAAVSAPVDPTTRLGLLDAVLGVVPGYEYDVDEGVGQVVEANYRGLRAICSPGSLARAEIVLRLVQASGAAIELLGSLDQHARSVAIRMGLYPVTEANLHTIVSGGSIALDVLYERYGSSYWHCINRLTDYMTAYEASPTTPHTMTEPHLFAKILTDASSRADALTLSRLIDSASDDCRVPMLVPSVPATTWPLLAAANRTDTTFENVKGYLDAFGAIDASLGPLLAKHETITGAEDVPLADRLEVAVAILAAREEIPDSRSRVGLAASVNPGAISATTIEPEGGLLVAQLIDAQLLVDDETAFSEELMVDWPTYEAAIIASENYATVVSVDILSVVQIPNLLRGAVSIDVKEAVVAELDEYLAGATQQQVQTVTRTLHEQGWKLGYTILEALRAAGADQREIINLAAQAGEVLDLRDLKELLLSMGDEYSKAATGGRGAPKFPDDQAHREVLERLVGATIRRVERKEFKTLGTKLVVYLR
ncbi:YobI family P-loop NTPase [Oerskovia gallyi]|uniref:YobI-like P-loop NTPase domain-containing protein n=1 Tax=Oerskovia gallyi TaxID=2762226 RepID=A0ABR8V1I1_9CELL|nr:hypothetical protein [Oerskovia gallyi]MBD7998653.1 hypothetical protein [Oerskovia gallyi]